MNDHATTGRPTTAPRRGLGRGLGSLIPTGSPAAEPAPPRSWRPGGHVPEPGPGTADWIGQIPPPGDPEAEQQPQAADQAEPPPSSGLGAFFAELPVDSISPNPRQPRQVFDEEAMEELVHSIREVGLLQPVVVRPVTEGHYQLVMGERRWRASERAGLAMIPAIVRETEDDALLRDGLLENLHRAQLNPLEEAAAYQQLLEDFGCTHEELASRIGRSRPQISNTLRLLKLSAPVQRRVAAGVLSAGHARALLGVAEPEVQDRLAARVVAEGLSVRTLEELVTVGELPDEPTRRPRQPRLPSPVADELAGRLGDLLDTRVRVEVGRAKSRILIECASVPDLERVAQRIDPTYDPQQDG